MNNDVPTLIIDRNGVRVAICRIDWLGGVYKAPAYLTATYSDTKRLQDGTWVSCITIIFSRDRLN